MRLTLTSALARRLDGISFRGKWRLLNAMCPRAGIADRMLFGRRVRLDLTEHIQRLIFLGLYEHGPTTQTLAYLKPAMTVVDVGANVGYYTLLALSRIGSLGRVVAIEPAARPRARLVDAVDGCPNVVVLACALGAARGRAMLYTDRETDNDSPTMVAGHGGVAEAVDVMKLDQCVGALGIQQVDLLKLDVEGWEPQILAGAASLLSCAKIRAILCEFNDHWLHAVGTSAERLYREILDYGFRDTQSGPLGALETRLLVHHSVDI